MSGNFLKPGFFQDHLDVPVPMITLWSKVQAHQALDMFTAGHLPLGVHVDCAGQNCDGKS